MSTDTAVTALTWLLAGLVIVAVISVVLVRRWAGRIAIAAVAVMLAAVGLVARADLADIPADSPESLCQGGVTWFGLHLTGPDELCAKYR